MTDFSHLLSPLQIGPIRVRNRVLVSAHVPGFAERNLPGERYIRYQQQYAGGGVGLQITGGTPIHTSGLLGQSEDALWNLNDDIIPGYRRLADAVHAEDGRILAQLAHSAGTVLINQPGRESWSASPIRSQTSGNVAHEMHIEQIREVTAAYAAGAARVAQGGLDGVEILAAFGFLPQAFLSPLSNRRQDEYGGSLENRLRFLLEVLHAVRAELTPEQVLGVRLPGDEFEPGGLRLEQMQEICRRIAETGLVDYLNIIAHTNFTHTGRSRHWAPTPSPHGTFVELAAAIRSVVTLPVFAVGRIIDPAHADSIIAAGKADMVGMTRAHICDPQIVNKIKRRQTRQIRPCVGANTCIANRYAGKPIRCMHNPLVALPGHVPPTPERRYRVSVIGAGPAGLEAARIAGEQGHAVTLYEANPQAGGQLMLWARCPSMGELQRIIDWRLAELERLGVELRLRHEITPPELAALPAERVIVATGAIDQARRYRGAAHIPHLTPHQVLSGHAIRAGHAIVCSDGRGQAGLAAAEWLLHRGLEVDLITSDFAVAADLDPTHRNAWYTRLGKLGARLTACAEIDHADGDCVLLRDIFSERISTRRPIDLIVDWDGCRANSTLAGCRSALGADGQLYAIGDCKAPRTVEIAIAEAAEVAELP